MHISLEQHSYIFDVRVLSRLFVQLPAEYIIDVSAITNNSVRSFNDDEDTSDSFVAAFRYCLVQSSKSNVEQVYSGTEGPGNVVRTREHRRRRNHIQRCRRKEKFFGGWTTEITSERGWINPVGNGISARGFERN